MSKEDFKMDRHNRNAEKIKNNDAFSTRSIRRALIKKYSKVLTAKNIDRIKQYNPIELSMFVRFSSTYDKIKTYDLMNRVIDKFDARDK